MARSDSFQKKWASVPSQFERPSDALIDRGWAGGAAEDPPEAKWENWWHNRVDEALAEIEKNGAMQWFADVPYAVGASVRSGGQNYIAALASTGIQPGSASDVGHWQPLSLLVATQAEAEAGIENTKRMTPLRVAQAIASRAVDSINTIRIDVASASTVNLTASAPNTRHINITGTTTINGFTVASGKCYFVRFDGVLTLTNGAQLVTQTGANITTAAGDTCIIRATAANTVEILAYTPGIPQGFGYRQTIQVVTGSRAINTNYTNTTGRTILVMASINSASGSQPLVIVNEVTIGSWSNNGSGSNINFIVFPVPAGATYRIGGGSSVGTWSELR